MASVPDFPKPKFVTGGCLCGAVRYRIDFADEFEFTKMTGTCQCTQCRRNTGSLFYPYLRADPPAKFAWLKPEAAPFQEPPPQYKKYSASTGAYRGFCATCGGFISWAKENSDLCSIAVGTVDPLYLWGDGADGVTEQDGQIVPKEGFGVALASGYGIHEWCGNQIKGVTDSSPLTGVGIGKRWMGETYDESAGVEG